MVVMMAVAVGRGVVGVAGVGVFVSMSALCDCLSALPSRQQRWLSVIFPSPMLSLHQPAAPCCLLPLVLLLQQVLMHPVSDSNNSSAQAAGAGQGAANRSGALLCLY